MQEHETKLLLVEDEAIIAMDQAMMMRRYGYDVVTAHRGEKAVELIEEVPDIALVLMDIDLGGGMDGTEAARRILECRELPIVFLTSHAEKNMVDRVKNITRYGYVLKGSGEFVLMESIQMAFELFRSQQQMRAEEQKARHQQRLYALLSQVNQAIIHTAERDALLQKVCSVSVEYGGMQRAELYLLQQEEEKLRRVGAAGQSPDEEESGGAEHAFFPGGKGTGGPVEKTLTGACVSAANDFGKEIGAELYGELRASGCRSMAAVPVMQRGEVLGVLLLCTKEDGFFGEAEEALLTEISSDVEFALGALQSERERRQTEELLKASERKYRNLFDNAPVGIFRTTSSGDVLDVNPTMARMVGASSPQEARNQFNDLAHQLYADPRRRDEFLRQLRSGREVHDFEYEAVRIDGERRWFSMHARIEEEQDDGSFIAEGFTEDVTERRQAERRLYESMLRARWLNEIGAHLLSGRGVEEIMKLTVKKLAEHFPEKRAAYSRLDKKGMLHTIYSEQPEGMPDISGLNADLSRAPEYLRLLRSGEAVVVHDTGGDERIAPLREDIEAGGAKAVIDLPLVDIHDAVGLLCLDAPEPTEWSAHAVAALQEIADYLSLALRAEHSSKEYDRFFELVPDLVCIAGADGYFRSVNRAWETTLGYSREELLGRPLLDFIHPEDREATMREVERQLDGESTVRFTNRYAAKSGEYRWLEWMATPAEGDLLFAAARDVTERKDAEQKYRILYETAPLPYQSLDAEGRILEVNPAWLETLSYSREEVIGRWFGDLLRSDYVERFRENFARFKQQGRVRGVEFTMIKGSGEEIDVSFEGCIGYTTEGKFRQTFCIFKDVTREKRGPDASEGPENT
jgi:PAS domain S-box-containing protein